MAASYGGYTKTSYGAPGGEDGGGFVYGASQSGSQSAQGGQKVCNKPQLPSFRP